MAEKGKSNGLKGENAGDVPERGENERKRTTRREFVKGTAVGAAGVAAAGVLAGCAPAATPTPQVIKETVEVPVEVTKEVIKEVEVTKEVVKEVEAKPWLPEKWDYEADVVVVGFGGAGACAAIEASDAGADVILLEKMPEGQEGGSSAICGGILGWKGVLGPGLRDVEGLRADTFGAIDEDYARAWGKELEDLVTWLEDIGVEMVGTIDTVLNAAPSGDLTGAQALFAVLKDEVNKRGINVMYETPGKELVQNPTTKEILGVIAESGGKQITIKAKKSVVLTNGNYVQNREMMHDFNLPGVYYATGTSPANTGDGHMMGMKVGARLWHMAMGMEWYGDAFKVPSQEYNTSVPPHPPSDAYILVDKYGKRFMNEQQITSPHNKGFLEPIRFNGEWTTKITENEYPHLPFFMVFDEKLRSTGPLTTTGHFALPGLGITDIAPFGWFALHKVYDWSADNNAEIAKGWIFKADTIEELAAKIRGTDGLGREVRVDSAGLVDTIAKYNEYCAAGQDQDFGRPTLLPIDTPPYYAIEECPDIVYTIGGLKHNAKCQTMGLDDKAIPRLYSAGDVGQVGVVKPDGVAGAMAFGRIAGRNAAAETPWE